VTGADNYEIGDDYWHARTELAKAWTKEMHQKLPVSGKGNDVKGNRAVRLECETIFEHAKSHWRRCAERTKEVFEANSAEVHAHLRHIQQGSSAYWTSRQLAAKALQLWFRRHCKGLLFQGKQRPSSGDVIAASNAVAHIQQQSSAYWTQQHLAAKALQLWFRRHAHGRWFKGGEVARLQERPKREDGTVFTGFDHEAHTKRTNAQPPTGAEVIAASKAVVAIELKCRNEMHKLRRLIGKRRAIARAAARKCWLEEFFMHMGKPGQPADHSSCPADAACNDPDKATKWNWAPLRTELHDPKTWPVVEVCLKSKATLKLLDGIITGEGTCHIESFHAMRCTFASKHRYFPRWAMRNTMAKMHFNENLRRDIKYQYETRVKRLGNKIVTKKIKTNVTWNWRRRVINKVVSRWGSQSQ
jgi:hypothetical protein